MKRFISTLLLLLFILATLSAQEAEASAGGEVVVSGDGASSSATEATTEATAQESTPAKTKKAKKAKKPKTPKAPKAPKVKKPKAKKGSKNSEAAQDASSTEGPNSALIESGDSAGVKSDTGNTLANTATDGSVANTATDGSATDGANEVLVEGNVADTDSDKKATKKSKKELAPQPYVKLDAEKHVIIEENEDKAVGNVKEVPLIPSEGIKIDPKTGFPVIKKIPYVMYNEGIAYAFLTRIQSASIPQNSGDTSRSNFVWQDHLVGAYFEIQTRNLVVNLLARVSAFYPFAHTFNGMENIPKQVILYAIDGFVAPYAQINLWNYVRINVGIGLHYMYQLTDEFHLHYLGAGQRVGLELPVSKHCNLLIDGMVTLDYANLGLNQYVQPYDWAYQVHGSIGFRYSLAGANKYSYASCRKGVKAKEAKAKDVLDSEDVTKIVENKGKQIKPPKVKKEKAPKVKKSKKAKAGKAESATDPESTPSEGATPAEEGGEEKTISAKEVEDLGLLKNLEEHIKR